MQDRTDGPPNHAERIAGACAEAVNQRPRDAVHHRIGEQKSRDNARVVDAIHMKAIEQHRRNYGKGLAIEIVDNGGEKSKADHEPALRVGRAIHRCVVEIRSGYTTNFDGRPGDNKCARREH